MTALILTLQVALPVALLAWLFLLPVGSVTGLALQTFGVGAFLFALANIAQWAVPVWWLPRVYLGLWVAAAVTGAFRVDLRDMPILPVEVRDWAGLAVSVVLTSIGGWYGAQAIAGRTPPPMDMVAIANPLGPGRYLVGHGGSNRIVNGHLRTLDTRVERFRPWRGQSHAVDFFGLGPWGFRARGWRPSDPAAYAIYGAEIRAPCTGDVVAAEGGMPDFDVPEQDTLNRLGNHVILRCGDVEIVLAHMRAGSVSITPGEKISVGDRLGAVGNSGASTEPHLHVHAQRPAADGLPPISGDPLPLRIEGRYLVRGERLSSSED
jgi:hypothetical protein